MSWIRRLAVYLDETFPLRLTVPMGVVHFLAVYLAVQALAWEGPVLLGWRSLPGSATVILLALLLRVQDELKDLETDLRLATAGDPAFRGRPLVEGRVTPLDLQLLWWVASLAALLLNLRLGWPLPGAAFATALGLVWLSGRWFFCPAIARSLLATFVTHNPLALVIAAYAASVALGDLHVARPPEGTWALLVAFWLQAAAWETSRKLRLPEAETAYPTYSRALGWRAAALLCAVFALGSASLGAWVARGAGLGWGLPLLLGTAACLPVWASLRLVAAPAPGRAKLRPWAEAHAALAQVGWVVALALERGVALP
ncbi:MAG: hypothetical protein HY722_11950 [Planctomycetes bacterium]|nr:hypothetical protein [Planctomycetota bacterium]